MAHRVKGIPDNSSVLIPRLVCCDVWTIATRIEETTAEERTERWSAILGDKQNA